MASTRAQIVWSLADAEQEIAKLRRLLKTERDRREAAETELMYIRSQEQRFAQRMFR